MNKLIAILYFIITYGSLYPFSFSLADFFSQLATWSTIKMPSIGDILGNILLFAPLGFAYRLNFISQSISIYKGYNWLYPFIVALAFATLLQVLQIGIPERDQNLADIVFNMLGLLIGYTLLSIADNYKVRFANPISALPLAIASVFVLAQLTPFLPSIDLQGFKNSIKPLLVLPNLSELVVVVVYGVYWLVAIRLVRFGWAVPIAYFSVGYIIFILAKVVIYNNTLAWFDVLSPLLAYIVFMMRDWQNIQHLRWLYISLIIAFAVSSLLGGETASSEFSILPFYSYLEGNLYVGVGNLLLKLSLFSSTLWLALELNYVLKRQALLLAVFIFLLELIQLLVVGRVFDIGDVVLVAIAYFTVRHSGDLLAKLPEIENCYEQAPAVNLSNTKATNLSKIFNLLGVSLFVFITFYWAVQVILSLPNIPYNVLELFRNEGTVVDIFFFFLFVLLITGGGSFWVSRKLLTDIGYSSTSFKAHIFILLITYVVLLISVSEESLQDVLGASIYGRDVIDLRHDNSIFATIMKILSLSSLASLATYIEYYIRFFALAGLFYFPYFITQVCLLSIANVKKVKSVVVAMILLATSVYISFYNAATDNLTELIASPLLISATISVLAICALVLSVALQLPYLKRILSVLTIYSLACISSWYLLNAGLEQVVLKYGNAFSAISFLLGPDRSSQLTEIELAIRWCGFVVSLLTISALAQGISTRFCQIFFNKVRASQSDSNLLPVWILPTAVACCLGIYVTYRLFGPAYHIQTLSNAFAVNDIDKQKSLSFNVKDYSHSPGIVKLNGSGMLSLSAAFKQAKDGDEITIGKGYYKEAVVLAADNIKVFAEHGAVIFGKATHGKGAILVTGDNATIDGLECHSIKVPSNNGSCIRLEGKGITLNNVYFHHSQGGLLGSPKGGDIIVSNSRFEYLGHGNFFHGLYSMENTRLIIRNSIFLNTQNGGHEIKSRSYYTEVTGSIIGSSITRDSRLIDLPNGGEVKIVNNTLIEGPYSENHDLLSWGVEGVTHSINKIEVNNNLLITDKPSASLISIIEKPDSIKIIGNIVVGNLKGVPKEQNTFFDTREEFGIKPAPFIPDLTK